MASETETSKHKWPEPSDMKTSELVREFGGLKARTSVVNEDWARKRLVKVVDELRKRDLLV